ncbi:MAG: hypothetical protein ACRCX2_14295 [Paraclostridium sp.]
MATNTELLKFNLQERKYPYFEDNEIELLLQDNDNNTLKASWKGCILKANADDGVSLGPIKTDSNRDYWLDLAKQYKSEYESSIRPTTSTGYKTSMKRADGQ